MKLSAIPAALALTLLVTVYLKGQLMTKGRSIHQEPDRQTCPAFLYL
jgi:hypothetical protein